MKRVKSLASLAVMATAFMAVGVPSASAVPAGQETAVTFELIGGSIGISVQPTADFGVGATGGAQGSLGEVVVTDARSGTGGWIASATRGEFSNGTTSSDHVRYNADELDSSGVVTPNASMYPSLSDVPVAVVTATNVTGNNTATWNPYLIVYLPLSSTAGVYSGTITTSVL